MLAARFMYGHRSDHRVSARRGGRVRADGAILGRAYGVTDLLEFLRRAGLNPDEVALDGPLIEWRGGGPYAWEPHVRRQLVAPERTPRSGATGRPTGPRVPPPTARRSSGKVTRRAGQ